MKRSKKPEPGPPVSMRVAVIEVPSDPGEVLERFKKLAVADAWRTAGARKAGRERAQGVEQPKREALAVAARLLQQNPILRLPRKKSELARRTRKDLDKTGCEPPSSRTIYRWLDEIIRPKK
jgi:hypothetical protein